MPFAQSIPVSASEGMAATAGFTAYPADASVIVRLFSDSLLYLYSSLKPPSHYFSPSNSNFIVPPTLYVPPPLLLTHIHRIHQGECCPADAVMILIDRRNTFPLL